MGFVKLLKLAIHCRQQSKPEEVRCQEKAVKFPLRGAMNDDRTAAFMNATAKQFLHLWYPRHHAMLD